MSAPSVLFDLDPDGVALITLNRPDKMNACSGDLLERLGNYYRRCDEDDAVRAVVVTGAVWALTGDAVRVADSPLRTPNVTFRTLPGNDGQHVFVELINHPNATN